MNKSLLSISLAVAATVSLVCAENWMPAGARGVGMGGAEVAVPQGSQAMLANPAALARKDQNRFDIALPVTVGVGAEGTVIETVNRLMDRYDSALDAKLNNFSTAANAADVLSFLGEVNDTLNVGAIGGVRANVQGMLTTRWKNLGLYAGTRLYAGAAVTGDTNLAGVFVNTAGASVVSPADLAGVAGLGSWTGSAADIAALKAAIVAQAGRSLTTSEDSLLTSAVNVVAGSATATTTSSLGLTVRTLQTQEIGAGYGFNMMEDKLHITPVFKVIKGETRAFNLKVLDTTNTDIADDLKEDNGRATKSSTQIGLDIGVLYEVSDKLMVGLTAKELTSPSFETPLGAEIELKPNVRLGLGYEYSQKSGWRGTLAADLDLLKSESSVLPGVDFQEFALGLNQELMGWLTLRAGLSKNFGGESDGLSYGGGIGLQLWRLYLDVSGTMSSDKVTVDGDDFPTSGGFGVTLGWSQNF
ncbi:MAG: conjugal transfer protein TraF [Planctomycetes bacterium]|nr:conjugal transfer protein TraF [Planctomycetota bacterium]